MYDYGNDKIFYAIQETGFQKSKRSKNKFRRESLLFIPDSFYHSDSGSFSGRYSKNWKIIKTRIAEF